MYTTNCLAGHLQSGDRVNLRDFDGAARMATVATVRVAPDNAAVVVVTFCEDERPVRLHADDRVNYLVA